MGNVVGAQLYTLKAHTQTIEDVRVTMQKVREIGYTAAQVSGFGPMNPEDIAEAAKAADLKIVATHVAWDRFQNDLEAVIAEHKLWGCKHSAIGALNRDEYLNENGVDRFLGELKDIAARLRQEDITFSYHNHCEELEKFGEKTWLRDLYDKADPADLKAELDVYWVAAGGGDPAEWIRSVKDRTPLLHLKDMTMIDFRKQVFAEVGEGNLNWPAILKAAKESGVEWYLVEQDDCYGRNEFDCLKTSYNNLVKMGLS